jgi:hypothetical protein
VASGGLNREPVGLKLGYVSFIAVKTTLTP